MKNLDLLRDVILRKFKDGEISSLLRNALVKGAIDRSLIFTSEGTRGIGKTTALVQFASEFGYAVIVEGDDWAKHLRDTFDYEHIYGEYHLHHGSLRGNNVVHKGIIVDENVNKTLLNDYSVITGFHYKK